MGALDSRGIYVYDETDQASLFSDLLNLLGDSVGDRLEALLAFSRPTMSIYSNGVTSVPTGTLLSTLVLPAQPIATVAHISVLGTSGFDGLASKVQVHLETSAGTLTTDEELYVTAPPATWVSLARRGRLAIPANTGATLSLTSVSDGFAHHRGSVEITRWAA